MKKISSKEFLVLCVLFAIFVTFALMRSLGWAMTSESVDFGHRSFDYLGYCLFGGVITVLIWANLSLERSAYFLGASVALGVFPQIPGLPFFQEVTHVFLAFFLVMNFRYFSPSNMMKAFGDSRVRIYAVFLSVTIVSVFLNYKILSDFWQLKVGISGLIYLVFTFFAFIFLADPSNAKPFFKPLLDGLIASSLIAAMLGLLVLVMLIVTPYSTGPFGDGRDTIWGLGYFDRLRLLFDSVGTTGAYFVLVLSMVVYQLVRERDQGAPKARGALLFLLHFSPWLVMAAGTRVAKLALLIVMLSGLMRSKYRPAIIISLPSALIAGAIGYNFQSFPFAIQYTLGYFFPYHFDFFYASGLVLGDRFFDLEERGVLIMKTIEFMKSAPWYNHLVGFGYGAAGFRLSAIPSPHNQFMDLWVEVGLIGLVAYLAFWFVSLKRAVDHRGPDWLSRIKDIYQGMFPIGVSVIALIGLSCAYESTSRSIMQIFLMLLFCWPKDGKTTTHG